MKTIYKYEFEFPADKIKFEMPKDAEILCVQLQNEKPCVWALVENENPKEERFFEIFVTGNEIRGDMGVDRKYIGTFQLFNGKLVFHFFEHVN